MSGSTIAPIGTFFDPTVRRFAMIYLDATHFSGQLYTRLQILIESGGGRIAPNKETASIWIVDPDAPYALSGPSENVTILYAPWLIACARKGSFLGQEQGDWCGFKVPPRKERATSDIPLALVYPEPAPAAPKPPPFPVRNPAPPPFGQSAEPTQPAGSNENCWANNTPKYPKRYSLVSARTWNIDTTSAPSPPPLYALEPANSVGKRKYSDAELTWMLGMIDWCLSKNPNMDLNTVSEVMSKKGPHRTSGGYISRLRRYSGWFVSRSPLFADCWDKCRAEEVPYDVVELSDSDTPPPPSFASKSNEAWAGGEVEKSRTTAFTDVDWDNFIRYAAARPNGMEPTGSETAAGVWEAFASQYPNHSTKSWRTWHQHWQHDLRPKIAEFRKAHLGI